MSTPATSSPITRAALTDMAAALHNPSWRFWTMEHPALMMLAVAFGHIGRTVARKQAGTAAGAGRAPFWWYLASLLALLTAMPWPVLSYGRPLLRLTFGG
jgi:hypothetical protein